MLRECTNILHDKFRLMKHLQINTLKDKVLFLFRIEGYKVGVIDIAIPEFTDVYNLTR